MSKLKKNPIIKLTYIYNDSISNVTFDINNNISSLKNLISLGLNLNVKNFEISYGRYKSLKDDKLIKDVILDDSNPIFIVKLKNNDHISKNRKGEIEQYGSNKTLLLDHSGINNSVISISNDRKATIKIENFPSLPEIYDYVKNFVKRKNLSKTVEIYNKGKCVYVSFTYPVSKSNI